MDIKKIEEKFDNKEVVGCDDFKGVEIDEIVDALEEIGLIEWSAYEYGEPNYKAPEKEILFANWNYVSNELQEKLMQNGYEIEWEDEWTCGRNGLAYRTQPDSYEWQPSYFIKDGEVLDIRENEEEYLEEIINNPRKAAPEWIDLNKHGFKVVEKEFEFGMHSGCRNITPEDVVKNEVRDNEDYVFQISYTGPWCTEFMIWKRIWKRDSKK